jgi:parallel beta-helix repeat protein
MRARCFVVAALGCFWLLTATASAVHVQCGDTIAQYTVLDSDVVCTDQDPVGLVIGANDVKLRLDGHTIQGAGAPGSDGIADDGTARSGVIIKGGAGGAITGFEDGVDLDVSNGTIMKLAVDATAVGISARGDDNFIWGNSVDMTGGAGFAAIEALGDDTFVWGNVVTGSATSLDDGIVVHGNNPEIVYNSVDGCAFDGVIATTYTAGMVARNTVTNCEFGFNPSGTGLRLQANSASGNFIGIVIDDPAAFVRRNTANDNGAVGILIVQAGATVRGNTANNNAEIGIDAPVGTIDKGENTATGNGTTDCLVVVCLPPLP